MCVLYKENTKEFVEYDTNTKAVTLTSSIKKASELTNQEAKDLLKKCTKKLKGFQIMSQNDFQSCNVVAQPAKILSPAQAIQQPEPEKTERRSFTAKERRDIYVRDEGKCGICGKFVAPDEFTIDHIIPISKGGTYDYENLQCCCYNCNQIKSNSMENDFYGSMLDILSRHIKKSHNKKLKKCMKKLKNEYAKENF